MFDIYGVIDLYKRSNLSGVSNPFLSYKFYDFNFKEYSIRTECAVFYFLEKCETTENYSFNGLQHVFIFGIVFSNKDYQSLTGQKPKRLTAAEVFALYTKHGRDIAKFIKGSFVLIFYDEKQNELLCINDHLNVLPIYYAFKNGVFVFSSAIKPILDSSIVGTSVDKTAIVEFALFDYTLGSKTYYEDISMLDCGKVFTVNEGGLKESKYFHTDSLFHRKLLNRQESFEMLSGLLHENTNLYAADAKKFLLSLTGGFDGRTNLALLDRPKDDFLCYSYGMPGSRQIAVPIEIAQRLNINYRPIYLDKRYEKMYEDCALKALFYSDGTAPILRADFPYAYQQLNDFARTAITGLFGSEILRPIRNLGLQINDNSQRLFLGDEFDANLMYILDTEKKRGYFQPVLFDECHDAIREYFWDNYIAKYNNVDKLMRFFLFFIGEGMRKYFMQEIRIERVFISTRFPYLDFDLIWLLFKTPFAGLYNGALKQSPIGRQKAQSLYCRLMEKYNPSLGKIVTDRGYKPNDLLSPVWFLKILPGYIRTRRYYKSVGNDTFNAERWTDLIFSQNLGLMKKETDIFADSLFEKYRNGANLIDNYYFSRIFSLKYWFEHEGK
jgi:hypothetical protein